MPTSTANSQKQKHEILFQPQGEIMTKQWFDVDKAGLGRQAEEQGKGRLVGELIQNALDEPGVTRIDVTLALVRGQPFADLTVEDDSAEGFKDLTHAYTLFAPSVKRANPEQRGQFNLGEKLVLATCEHASIATTKGTVIFDAEQGRIEKPDRRERGSVFHGRIKMSQEEYAQVCDYLRSLLLPDGITVTFNGERLLPRKPIHSFQASLETQIADDKGLVKAYHVLRTVGRMMPWQVRCQASTKWVFPSWTPGTSGTCPWPKKSL